MSVLLGWRLPLRIARREAVRAKGRSLLVLVMIALPVLAVSAADVLMHTADLNSRESLDRRLGMVAAAKVMVWSDEGSKVAVVRQGLDPEYGGMGSSAQADLPTPTIERVLTAFGGDREATRVRDGRIGLRTDKGRANVSAYEVDPASPLLQGRYELKQGRWPTAPGEVAVSSSLLGRVPGIGGTAELYLNDGKAARTVVGVVDNTGYRHWDQVVGVAGSLGLGPSDGTSWLVGGGPVSWDDVLAANRLGALVLSRDVVLHPTSAALAADRELNPDFGADASAVTVLVLVVAMVLLEVVLLAGPAFAVGARRQSRALALIAAAGGTPKQARRVVLATGVVLGTVGGVLGVGLGVLVAYVGAPVAQLFDNTRFGAFEVPWLQLLGIGAFGLVSALLAAVVPAWIASRQNVVAVLAGRRGDRAPSARRPWLGVLLLAAGVVLAYYGGRPAQGDQGAVLITGSALACVLGMLFLIPVAVALVARAGRLLPLSLRFAVRDANRHRTRTVPAVAAVAATVAGIAMMGIAMTSDAKENEATYTPSLAIGDASVNADIEPDGRFQPDWDAMERIVTTAAPDAQVQRPEGVLFRAEGDRYYDVQFRAPGAQYPLPLNSWRAQFSSVLVSDGAWPAFLRPVEGMDVAAAERMLKEGGVVVFARDAGPDRVDVVAGPTDESEGAGDEAGNGSGADQVRLTVPALVVPVGFHEAPAQAVVSRAVAKQMGLTTGVMGLHVSGVTIDKATQRDIEERIQDLDVPGSLYVERGYQPDGGAIVAQLVMIALGAVLMIGGTLTATFLALSDARPDLATLSAVGAAPATRRRVAGAYAFTIGAVGALLGAAVGFVPGIAAAYSATDQSWRLNECRYEIASTPKPDAALLDSCTAAATGPMHYLDIPWLTIAAVVVLLPLLVSAIVWLSARSRLPLVARLA